MVDEVQASFDARATAYDANRRSLIPHFDEFYRIGVEALAYCDQSPRVLDLGGGTGLSTSFLLGRYPDARVTLLDFSNEMLAVARERFKDNPNIDFRVRDYRSFPFDERFDLVISGLSIHHLTADEKRELAVRVFGLLEPNGEFFNADLVSCEDERLEQEMHRQLQGFLRQGLSEDEVQRFVSSQRLDRPAPLESQLSHLRSAGFKVVECLYRHLIYGVFYAQK
ncbi:MAG: class I SAM-dependent methyltransferase [Coriobacteriales bacterium]|jgi:tRNA (cmo5U34)-methyltransferase|nr:class I SAM-dependent methyltransferase [Coriobacteriales bacterium]